MLYRIEESPIDVAVTGSSSSESHPYLCQGSIPFPGQSSIWSFAPKDAPNYVTFAGTSQAANASQVGSSSKYLRVYRSRNSPLLLVLVHLFHLSVLGWFRPSLSVEFSIIPHCSVHCLAFLSRESNSYSWMRVLMTLDDMLASKIQTRGHAPGSFDCLFTFAFVSSNIQEGSPDHSFGLCDKPVPNRVRGIPPRYRLGGGLPRLNYD